MKAVTNNSLAPLKSLLQQTLYPQALRASTSFDNPQLSDATYSLFVKSGFILDPFLSTSLISRACLSGDFLRASQFLRDTQNPDTVAYNSLISGYASFGLPEPVFKLFNGLRQQGLKPDVYTLSSLVKACGCLHQIEIAHGVSIRMGFVSSVFLVSGLVDNYSKSGFIVDSEKCFEECLVLDSVVSTAMVNGYVSNGEFEKARKVFLEMRVFGLEMNEFSLTSVLGAVFDVREGEAIHGFAAKMGFLCGYSTHLSNALMTMYCRCGFKYDAVKVFDEIPNPDVVSWTGRIGTAYDDGEAMLLFKCCISSGLKANEYTMINILSAIQGPNKLFSGKEIHALCFKIGCVNVVSVCNALISMYGKTGQMDDARCVFDEMSFQDVVSWNSLITGYSENGLASQALAVLQDMRGFLLHPNNYTLASILEVVSNSNSLAMAMQVHSLIIKIGLISNDSMLSCLITAYGKCNRIDESKKVFDETDAVDTVLLNAMTGTFMHGGCYYEVLRLFQQARLSKSVEVDNVTFSLILKACGVLTDMEQGQCIHSLAIKSGMHTDNFIESAVIDVYCNCGSIDYAVKVFKNINNRNLAAWNAMIMGYAQCGCYHEVFCLFRRIHDYGILPDEITYLGILSSCCHAGFINEAQYHLKSMSELYGLIPHLEHYACVVDVLGRAGLLEDAKRIIDQMPINPDGRIWQIFLSACTIHGNIDLGKVAARKLVELQPRNDSAFVLLSNLYASAGMWNAAGQLREEMNEKLLYKEPGFSLVQV